MAKDGSPTFLVDRSLGRHAVVEALIAAGVDAIAHDDTFPQNTEDTVWLAEAGRSGWVVLTKDSALRRNPLERDAYRASRARVFVLTSQNMTAADMVALFIKAMPQILEACVATEPPCVFGVYRSGALKRLD